MEFPLCDHYASLFGFFNAERQRVEQERSRDRMQKLSQMTAGLTGRKEDIIEGHNLHVMPYFPTTLYLYEHSDSLETSFGISDLKNADLNSAKKWGDCIKNTITLSYLDLDRLTELRDNSLAFISYLSHQREPRRYRAIRHRRPGASAAAGITAEADSKEQRITAEHQEGKESKEEFLEASGEENSEESIHSVRIPYPGGTPRVLEGAIPFLLDAALAYHFCAAQLREENWAEHYLWFLFLSKFSPGRVRLVTSQLEDRRRAYEALLKIHLDEGLSVSDCPDACLKSYLSLFWRVNPRTMLEAIAWLADDANERSRDSAVSEDEDPALLLEEDNPNVIPFVEKRVVIQHSYLSRFNREIVTALRDLDLDGERLLLQGPESLGGMERRVLLDLFGIDAVGVERQDVASGLASLVYNINQARETPNTAPVKKLAYFQRAIEINGDIRRRWSSNTWFDHTLSSGDLRSLPLKDALRNVDGQLRSAIAELPILPRMVEDHRWLTEIFYFVFLVDHENFWGALKTHLKDFHSIIHSYKLASTDELLFEHNYQWKPTWRLSENRKLMDFLLGRIKRAWSSAFGISDFDYTKAYAYWENFSLAHREAYKAFQIETADPTIPSKQREGADRRILRDMSDEIPTLARQQGKKVFYVLVSGDADYSEYVNHKRRYGAEYSYWYFKSQPVRDNLENLTERREWLENILALEEFTF
jgi:hypothetical protein